MDFFQPEFIVNDDFTTVSYEYSWRFMTHHNKSTDSCLIMKTTNELKATNKKWQLVGSHFCKGFNDHAIHALRVLFITPYRHIPAKQLRAIVGMHSDCHVGAHHKRLGVGWMRFFNKVQEMLLMRLRLVNPESFI